MPKYCSECGAGNPDTAKFCQQCGAPLEAGVERVEPAPYTSPVQPSTGFQGNPQGSQGVPYSPQGMPYNQQGMPGGMPGQDLMGQGAHLRLRVADVAPRVAAYIIDIIILVIIVNVLELIPIFQFNILPASDVQIEQAASSGNSNALLALINWGQVALEEVFSFVIYFLYFGLLETYNKGQTIGKLALKLRSVRERDGQPVGPQQGFVNAITKSQFLLLIIDLLIGLLSQRNPNLRQIRLAQRLTGEVVIKITG
jgi:uncharacterized RDD family membrane protein YckC